MLVILIGVSFIEIIEKNFLYFVFLIKGAPLVDDHDGKDKGTLMGILRSGSVII